MHDTKILDKYLNMEPTKKKEKVDFTIKFDNKNQKIAVILFGVGLLFVIIGVSLLVANNLKAKETPVEVNKPVPKGVVTKKFNKISVLDNTVTVTNTNVSYSKKTGMSDFNLNLVSNIDYPALALKIIFNVDGKDVVIPQYMTDIKSNENVAIFMQSEYNLTKSAGWKIEVTTLEDLMLNYGYNY